MPQLVEVSGLLLIILLFIGGFDSPVAGQEVGEDCGLECRTCPGDGYEGYDHDNWGHLNMQCFEEIPNCVLCKGENMVGSISSHVSGVSHLIKTADAAELSAGMASFPGELLLLPRRNLVVVKGDTCNPDILRAAIFVDARRMEVLTSMGLGLFAQSLDAQVTD